MAQFTIKSIVSKYKGVQGVISGNGNTYWSARICRTEKRGYKTEREAAKAVDIILIKNGREPVNILVRK